MLWNTLCKTNWNALCQFKENTVNKNSSVKRTRQSRLMLVSNVFCGKKKSSSLKIKKIWLLSRLGIKTP